MSNQFIIVSAPHNVTINDAYLQHLEDTYGVKCDTTSDNKILIKGHGYNVQQVAFHEIYVKGENVRKLHPDLF